MLETRIAELIAALDRNTAAHSGKPAVAAPKVQPAPAAKEEKPAATTNAEGKALDYEKDIKALALALAKKNRPGLTAIWTELGVKVGSELKPEQLARALALITEASK